MRAGLGACEEGGTLTNLVHQRRLAEPQNEKYTAWWVTQVVDALRSLPVHERMEAMGMERDGQAGVTSGRTGTTRHAYIEVEP